jgi:hypothetical protein
LLGRGFNSGDSFYCFRAQQRLPSLAGNWVLTTDCQPVLVSNKLPLVFASTVILGFGSRGIHGRICLPHDSGGGRRIHTARVSVSGKFLLSFASTVVHYTIKPSRISIKVNKLVSFFTPPFPAISFVV